MKPTNVKKFFVSMILSTSMAVGEIQFAAADQDSCSTHLTDTYHKMKALNSSLKNEGFSMRITDSPEPYKPHSWLNDEGEFFVEYTLYNVDPKDSDAVDAEHARMNEYLAKDDKFVSFKTSAKKMVKDCKEANSLVWVRGTFNIKEPLNPTPQPSPTNSPDDNETQNQHGSAGGQSDSPNDAAQGQQSSQGSQSGGLSGGGLPNPEPSNIPRCAAYEAWDANGHADGVRHENCE